MAHFCSLKPHKHVILVLNHTKRRLFRHIKSNEQWLTFRSVWHQYKDTIHLLFYFFFISSNLINEVYTLDSVMSNDDLMLFQCTVSVHAILVRHYFLYYSTEMRCHWSKNVVKTSYQRRCEFMMLIRCIGTMCLLRCYWYQSRKTRVGLLTQTECATFSKRPWELGVKSC